MHAGLTNTTQNAAKVLSAAAAATPPIRTFVIGIGNVPSLDQLAVAGGTGKAIVVGATDASDASTCRRSSPQAFARIRWQALPCEYAIFEAASAGFDPGEVDVTFNPWPQELIVSTA